MIMQVDSRGGAVEWLSPVGVIYVWSHCGGNVKKKCENFGAVVIRVLRLVFDSRLTSLSTPCSGVNGLLSLGALCGWAGALIPFGVGLSCLVVICLVSCL